MRDEGHHDQLSRTLKSRMPFELEFEEHAGNSVAPRLTNFGSKQSTLALRVTSKKYFKKTYIGPKVQRSNLSAPLPSPAAQAQGPRLC